MSSKSELAVVLDPMYVPGLVEAISAEPGVNPVTPSDPGGVASALATAGVLIGYRWFPAYLAPGLRWVQSVSVGTEQFPLDALGKAGVVLTSARGISGEQVSEHAIGLLLALTRGIAGAVRAQIDRKWRWPPVEELAGRTLGLLGLGAIGEAIAVRAAAFGMNVIGTKRDVSDYEGVAKEVLPPERTIDVFRRADAVIVALPGGNETAGMVGAAELAALEGGWLVNIGRGSVVDEAALIDALERGILAGAALDVFTTEPLPKSSPLWDVPNLIISPHLAGASPRYGAKFVDLLRRNLAAFRGEGPWVNRVV